MSWFCSFLFTDTATTSIYTLSLHDALPISPNGAASGVSSSARSVCARERAAERPASCSSRSEEHTSELQSLRHLVCRLLLEKKNRNVGDSVHRRGRCIAVDHDVEGLVAG